MYSEEHNSFNNSAKTNLILRYRKVVNLNSCLNRPLRRSEVQISGSTKGVSVLTMPKTIFFYKVTHRWFQIKVCPKGSRSRVTSLMNSWQSPPIEHFRTCLNLEPNLNHYFIFSPLSAYALENSLDLRVVTGVYNVSRGA